jgi:hypothetical protein
MPGYDMSHFSPSLVRTLTQHGMDREGNAPHHTGGLALKLWTKTPVGNPEFRGTEFPNRCLFSTACGSGGTRLSANIPLAAAPWFAN